MRRNKLGFQKPKADGPLQDQTPRIGPRENGSESKMMRRSYNGTIHRETGKHLSSTISRVTQNSGRQAIDIQREPQHKPIRQICSTCVQLNQILYSSVAVVTDASNGSYAAILTSLPHGHCLSSQWPAIFLGESDASGGNWNTSSLHPCLTDFSSEA